MSSLPLLDRVSESKKACTKAGIITTYSSTSDNHATLLPYTSFTKKHRAIFYRGYRTMLTTIIMNNTIREINESHRHNFGGFLILFHYSQRAIINGVMDSGVNVYSNFHFISPIDSNKKQDKTNTNVYSFFFSFFLVFGFCRFCVVFRFFHPRHNGQ